VRLRPTVEADLLPLFDQQRDPEACAMAAFQAREWAAFLDHWHNAVLGSQTNISMTVEIDGEVAGYVASWLTREGAREVGYCFGRAYWGRGIATAALSAFLSVHETRRPLGAVVAAHNVGSLRVLEKCGFRQAGDVATASDGVAEIPMQLTAGSSAG
jgi:RimJ/RimL family protein N-acetyltransferase